jgi:hypothetical protein
VRRCELTVGALQETIRVGDGGRAASRGAAVQMQTTSDRSSISDERPFVSELIGLMPGGAPYMIQAGGIGNPARSMGVSINGQPPSNTLFRIDGAMTNRWYPTSSHTAPALEAVRRSASSPVSTQTRGMAGSAAVNVR